MSFYMMIVSILSMFWFRNSIIQFLLSLELLLISCFICLISSLSSISTFSLFFFMSVMVSGSALGLSLLVSSSRHHHSSSSSHIFNLLFDKNYYSINYLNFL